MLKAWQETNECEKAAAALGGHFRPEALELRRIVVRDAVPAST
jgi:hypothetical protein